MKKGLLVLIASILVIASVSIIVFADGTNVTSTISETNVKSGDTFTFVVSMNEALVSSVGVDVSVDSGLEIVSGEWVQDGLIAVYDEANQKGAFMPAPTATNLSGDIFKLTLKVKDSAAGTQNVSINVIAKNSVNTVFEEATSKSVMVECKEHSFGTKYECDENGHSQTCSVCGYVLSSEHSWDNGVITTDPTCTEAGLKTYTCTECGYDRGEAIPATGHSYSEVWEYNNASTHKKVCSACDDVITEAHTIKVEGREEATCQHDGFTGKEVCEVCHGVISEGETIPKLDHKYEGGKCVYCGEADPDYSEPETS